MAKRLYTEASIRALRPGAEIVLGSEALATPAALDLAFARGIRVRWSDNSASEPVNPARSDLWERMLASEGEFIVRVRDGRAQVFRLTEEGPVLFDQSSSPAGS